MTKPEDALPEDILQLAKQIVDADAEGNNALVAHQATVLAVMAHALTNVAVSKSYQDIQGQLIGKEIVRDVEDMLKGLT